MNAAKPATGLALRNGRLACTYEIPCSASGTRVEDRASAAPKAWFASAPRHRAGSRRSPRRTRPALYEASTLTGPRRFLEGDEDKRTRTGAEPTPERARCEPADIDSVQPPSTRPENPPLTEATPSRSITTTPTTVRSVPCPPRIGNRTNARCNVRHHTRGRLPAPGAAAHGAVDRRSSCPGASCSPAISGGSQTTGPCKWDSGLSQPGRPLGRVISCASAIVTLFAHRRLDPALGVSAPLG